MSKRRRLLNDFAEKTTVLQSTLCVYKRQPFKHGLRVKALKELLSGEDGGGPTWILDSFRVR